MVPKWNGPKSFDVEFAAHQRSFNRMRTAALLGFLVIGVIVFGGALIAFFGDGADNRAYAEQEAQRYGQALYPRQSIRAVCQSADTDRNGYVSCTMVVGSGDPMPIECANRYALRNEGCRPMRYPMLPYSR